MNMVRHSSGSFGFVYFFGVVSCAFHGVDLWVSIFWPLYLGAVYADTYVVSVPVQP